MFRWFGLILLGLLASSVNATPGERPFEERYPPKSITSDARAEEVIRAYDKEVQDWESWKRTEDMACQKKFLVNDCLASNKKRYNEEVAKARRVWVVARDFQRHSQNIKSTAERKEKLKKQEERNKLREARDTQKSHNTIPLRQVTPKSEDLSRSEQTRTTDKKYTAEEIKHNEEVYQEKQAKHEQRVAQESKKVPKVSDPQEREEKLSERRRLAEQKRLDNIRKRTNQAAEYQRQLEMRENQSNRVLDDLSPIIFK